MLLDQVPAMATKIDEFEQKFGVIDANLSKLQADLQKVVPDIEENVRKLIENQEKSEMSIAALNLRDKEVSDKLAESFTKIDAQIAELKVQAGAAMGAQQDASASTARQMQRLAEQGNQQMGQVAEFVRSSLDSVRAEARTVPQRSEGGDRPSGGGAAERPQEDRARRLG